MIEVDIQLPRRRFDLIIQETFGPGITGLYGSSGAGKTSLLQAIAGINTPKEGRIVVNDRVLFDSQKRIHIPIEKRHIGYVFQEGRLFPHLTVEQNLNYGIKENSTLEVSFKEIIDLLQLESLLKQRPNQISGGERQRTALGRALLSSPSLLLLDEPLSAIDIRLRQPILSFLSTIQTRLQIPMLIISHDLTDLLKLTDALCIIEGGKCIGHGKHEALCVRPELGLYLK